MSDIFSASSQRQKYESGDKQILVTNEENMVRITEDLVRKRAEHNNCELSTLEEVSLHQLDIERIEILDKVCRELKILYLQSNLIPKIENVGRLKKLEYLNLALNNVEKIENLEGCESLQKLDLTVNFVGELTSIKSLRDNYHLQELFLTGNPCTQFTGYREYVITTLPQLQSLDGKEIEKSERILAKQDYENIVKSIVEQEAAYKKEIVNKRSKQEKKDGETDHSLNNGTSKTENEHNDEQDDTRQLNQRKSRSIIDTLSIKLREHPNLVQLQKVTRNSLKEQIEYTPESKIEIHRHLEEKRREKEKKEKSAEKVEKEVRFFAKDGRPLNMNQGKLEFKFTDDEEHNAFLFDLACPKYLDTSLINVDLQTTYLRVTVKGKIMQLALAEEIKTDSSTAKRSQITGHLLLTMPKLKGTVKPNIKKDKQGKPKKNDECKSYVSGMKAKLEVDPTVRREVDFGNIVQEKTREIPPSTTETCVDSEESEDFIDDPDVPPLI